MSYMLDLDEYSDERLVAELNRRQARRAQGKCAYCGYAADHSDFPNKDPKYNNMCLRGGEIGVIPVLTFARLREQNVARLERWHGTSDAWSGADWSNAMNGEMGETLEAVIDVLGGIDAAVRLAVSTGTVANTIKKIRRHETGLGTSHNTPELQDLADKLAAEVADVVIYADLLANHYGLDLTAAIIDKFNKVSINNGFFERL